MKPSETKGKEKKHSILNPSSKLLHALKKIYLERTGTVSYVFIQEKTIFTDSHPLGMVVESKSITMAPINPIVFEKETKGKIGMKSIQEILDVFQGTCDDLGADYFIVS